MDRETRRLRNWAIITGSAAIALVFGSAAYRWQQAIAQQDLYDLDHYCTTTSVGNYPQSIVIADYDRCMALDSIGK